MGLQAIPHALVPHAVQHCCHDPSPGSPERMTESDSTAVRVHKLRVGADVGQPGERDRGEHLVHLEGSDVVESETATSPAPSFSSACRCGVRPMRATDGGYLAS